MATSLNPNQVKIIQFLASTKVKRNISQIAKQLNISFPTAKKHLEFLEEKKVLKVEKRKKKEKSAIKYELVYSFDFDRHEKRVAKVKKKKVIKKKPTTKKVVNKKAAKKRTRKK